MDTITLVFVVVGMMVGVSVLGVLAVWCFRNWSMIKVFVLGSGTLSILFDANTIYFSRDAKQKWSMYHVKNSSEGVSLIPDLQALWKSPQLNSNVVLGMRNAVVPFQPMLLNATTFAKDFGGLFKGGLNGELVVEEMKGNLFNVDAALKAKL